MVRRSSLLFIACLFHTLSCDTGNNVDPVFEDYFIKYYGEDGNQEGIDLLVNADGSMILIGNTSASQTNPATIPFIVKVDQLGNVLWQRRFGGTDERAIDVELDRQGNLIVVSNIGDEANSRIRIFRIDQQGNGMDSLKIEMGEKQVAKSVTQASDNNILIAGYAEPNIVRNPELIVPPADVADNIIIKIDEAMTGTPTLFLDQGGGEHIGSAVKVFETIIDGATRFLVFGDSDRPESGPYKRSFEVIGIDIFGIPAGIRQVSGDDNKIQITSAAIETRAALQDGYLMIGTSYAVNNSTSDVYITQYDKTLAIKRLDMSIEGLNKRLEGISAAIGDLDDFYILANEITVNNKHDIFLLKMASDGAVRGSISFGTLEGDDIAGSVSVLPDRRVALFGTIELETQKKMALMIIRPDGKFSN